MIKEATKNDLDGMACLGQKFYDIVPYLNDFNPDHFKKTWEVLMESGVGKAFILKNNSDIFGMLGAITWDDLNDGKKAAQEMFWFVDKNSRGKGHGMSLFKAFEKWAIEIGCKKLLMAYIVDVMPEKIKSIYNQTGYRLVENHYLKEI